MFKSLITASAVLVMAAPAFASKARMASLQNAANLIDTQSIFDNPGKSYLMGDFATLEMGAQTTATTGVNTPENLITNGTSAAVLYGPDAEGGFVKSYGDSKIGFYMGRKSPFTTRMRALTGFAGQINPIELMYGFQAADLKMGVALSYSKAEPKTTGAQQKEDAMGIRFGAVGTNWDAGLTFGLGSNATGNAAVAAGAIPAPITAGADSTYKGTTGFKLNGGYWFDKLYVFANYYQDGAKVEGLTVVAPAAATIEQSQYEIGVIDTMKGDGMNFFYGASYIGFKSKAKDITTAVGAVQTGLETAFSQEQTQLPFIIGVEADAASWLVLRASARQNVILGSTKPNTGDTSSNIDNNTSVAVGAGLKFNKFTLDSTLAAGSVPGVAGSGAINANSLMANASLTYMF